MKTLAEILEGGHRIVRAELVNQLYQQGHTLTGALEASISANIKGEELEGTAYAYLHKLSEGVLSTYIKIDAQSRAEMTRYVQLRMGYTGKKAERVAYLILRAQQREGMPTDGSYAYTRNGERLNSIPNTFDRQDENLADYMLTGVDKYIGFNDKNEDL